MKIDTIVDQITWIQATEELIGENDISEDIINRPLKEFLARFAELKFVVKSELDAAINKTTKAIKESPSCLDKTTPLSISGTNLKLKDGEGTEHTVSLPSTPEVQRLKSVSTGNTGVIKFKMVDDSLIQLEIPALHVTRRAHARYWSGGTDGDDSWKWVGHMLNEFFYISDDGADRHNVKILVSGNYEIIYSYGVGVLSVEGVEKSHAVGTILQVAIDQVIDITSGTVGLKYT